MPTQGYTRTKVRDTRLRDPGPYEAIVVSHLDPMSMGTLEVEIVRNTGSGSTPERSGQLVTVRYLTPFYGVTPVKGLTPNDGFQYTQKSYGMWMVPPDVGTRVLVIFAEGNTAYGYWIGCIPEIGMNFTMPSGSQASTTLTTASTPENLKNAKLPVGEYNKLVEKGSKVDPTLFEKPYNKDFTEILEVQGLINDEARGTTTSSARRETPSMVFGISTPGPLDKRNGSPTAKYGSDTETADFPFNRLGGSSFVMDDGDDRFIRATHAADGPPVYINRENKEPGGDETIPQNELVRLRTRTGHQILLHNSEDLIYIANARGTAWIELTSDGKIDVYAYDSISVTSHNDINFTAERDFNIDAGRNINMRAQARYSDGKESDDGIECGRVQIESAFNTHFEIGKDFNVTVHNNHDLVVGESMQVLTVADYHLHSQSNIYQLSDNSTHETAGQSWYRQAGSNINDSAGATYFNLAGADSNFVSGSEFKVSAGGSISNTSGSSIHHAASAGINLLGGSIIAGDAGQIYWNSGRAAGGPAAGSASPPTPPDDAEPVERLTQIVLPFIIPGAQQAVPYESILARSPQHEPWPHHENYDPKAFSPVETDRDAPGELGLPDRVLTPDTFRKNKDGLTVSTFVPAIGAANKEAFGQSGDGLVNTDGDAASGNRGGGSGGADRGGNQGGGDYGGVSYGPGGKLVSVRSASGKSAQVAECFAEYFQGFINDLEKTGYRIKSMGGYARRKIVGKPGKWSVHSSGAAIDINPPTPAENKGPNGLFRPRPKNAPITDMPVQKVLELCRKWGLGWGGNWTSADDAMHFSAAKNEKGRWPVKLNGVIPTTATSQGKAPARGTGKGTPPPPKD